MDSALKEQLIRTMLRFRKVGMTFPPEMDIRMGELMIMRGIAGHLPPGMHGDHDHHPHHDHEKCQLDMHRKVFVSDLQKMHNITKPAISQMLNGLEHKGYVSREMDKADRRKVSVTLTDKGKAMLEETKKFADKTLDETIERFGEDNIRQLISLFNRLIDISNEIKEEKLTTTSKGETDLD